MMERLLLDDLVHWAVHYKVVAAPLLPWPQPVSPPFLPLLLPQSSDTSPVGNIKWNCDS